MCQLLGMNANTPTDVMFSFTGLATRADEHKDGFGIAFFEDKGLRLFIDPESARHSPVAEMVRHLYWLGFLRTSRLLSLHRWLRSP